MPTAANLEYYAHIIEDKALLRRLIRTATQIATDGYSREDELDMLMDEAEKSILEVSQRKMLGRSRILKMSLLKLMTILKFCIIAKVILLGFQLDLTNLIK